MAKRNKTKSARPLLKLEALEQRQLLAGGFTSDQGQEFSNIVHANGNVYDQVLLKTSAITVTNDAGQITRVSFLDTQGDIVQAEFSGAGQLSISLDNFTGPAEATKYNQPGVKYVSGLASFTIQGSDATTNFSVFSVGSATANGGKDSPLFSTGLTGGNNTADVARVTVVANPANPNGSTFGGIRAGNAVFSAAEGPVGISAANVQVQNVVTIGNINATGTATPTLVFGAQSQFGAVTVAGGSLVSDNGKAVNNTGSYAYGINLAAGTNSSGTVIPAADASTSGSFTGANPLNATANTFTLTVNPDTIPGLAGTAGTGNGGNDTINATIDAFNSTLSALDNLNGGKGNDTLALLDLAGGTALPGGLTLTSIETVNFRSAGAANIDVSAFADVTALNVSQGTSSIVTAAKTTAVQVSGISGNTTADGGSSVSVSTSKGSVAIGGTTAPVGAISATHTSQGTGTIGVDGGTTVAVTASGSTTGTVTVGNVTAPTGAVTVTSTGAAYDATGGNVTLGAIAVTGGSSITVTQTPASSSADAATDATATSITQSAVAITGSKLTTAVTVNAGAPVTAVNYVAAAGSKEVSEVTFVAMTAGQTVIVEGLTFTAAKALTADQAAAAFANLAASASQGTAAVSSGVYSGTLGANFVSGAASGAKVTFTGASNGNLNIAAGLGGTAAPSVTTNTDGASTVTTTAGVMGVIGGKVSVADSGDKTIASVSLAGYGGAKEKFTVTFGGTAPANGDTLIFDGVTTTYVDASPTLAELITAAAAKTYTNWNVTGSTATTITFEARSTANVTDAVAGDFTGTAITVTGGTATPVVSVQGAGNSTVASDALTSLSLSKSNGDVTVTNAAATTLALTLNAVGTSTSNAAGINVGATYTTINLNSAGASWAALNAPSVTNLNVSGSAVANLGSTNGADASTLSALTTVTVTGSAGLTLGTAASTTITSFDASGTSGAVSTSLVGNVGTYKGSTGADTVTLTGTTVSKAIDLGGGNDTVNLASGTTTLGAVITGGDGVDTLKFGAVADAVTASTTSTFSDSINTFEKISLPAGAASTVQTVNLDNLDAINYVISANAGATGGELALTNMPANGTVEINAGRGDATSVVSAALKDATGTADTLNVITTNSGSVNFGTVKANGVENIKLTVTDTTTSTLDTHTVTIKADELTTLTVTGTAKLNLTLDTATTKLATIDASAMATAVTVNANTGTAVSQTIKGGSAADSLTASYQGSTLQGGGGGDTLIVNGKSLVTLTGGTGADTFNVSTATTNVNSYATVTDLESTDKIVFGTTGAPGFKAAAIVLDPTTAVFQDYANAAIAANAQGEISWFQYNGNTYLVQDQSNNASSFVNATDIIVKVSGLKDLSTASFNSTSATLLIV